PRRARGAREKGADLDQTGSVHTVTVADVVEPYAPTSETLRTDERPEEIDDEGDCDDSDKDVFHGSQLSARVDVGHAEQKEAQRYCYKDEVDHEGLPGLLSL